MHFKGLNGGHANQELSTDVVVIVEESLKVC